MEKLHFWQLIKNTIFLEFFQNRRRRPKKARLNKNQTSTVEEPSRQRVGAEGWQWEADAGSWNWQSDSPQGLRSDSGAVRSRGDSQASQEIRSVWTATKELDRLAPSERNKGAARCMTAALLDGWQAACRPKEREHRLSCGLEFRKNNGYPLKLAGWSDSESLRILK